MTDEKKASKTVIDAIPLSWVIFGLLGYFVYGQTLNGALGMILITIMLSISVLISIIPFAGALIQIILSSQWIIPSLLTLTGLYDTWLISVIFVITSIVGIIITVLMTYYIIYALRD